jgi:hypothetical protein
MEGGVAEDVADNGVRRPADGIAARRVFTLEQVLAHQRIEQRANTVRVAAGKVRLHRLKALGERDNRDSGHRRAKQRHELE